MDSPYDEALEHLKYSLPRFSSNDYDWRDLRDKVLELQRDWTESTPYFLSDEEYSEWDVVEPEKGIGAGPKR